jgi:hypothetical protein
MFSLFRSKKRRLASARAPKQLTQRHKIEPGQYERPSLEGYAVEELQESQLARSDEFAGAIQGNRERLKRE